LSIFSALPNSKTTNVVINLSTSFITEEIIEPYNKKLIRSKVGESNVVGDMQKTHAFFGGEGNGGVIDPEINSYGRDSLSGIAHILNMLAYENTKIDRKLDTLPEIFMEKKAFSIKGKDLNSIFDKLKNRYRYAKPDTRDGLWLGLIDGWLHVRASNTEPIIRVIAEAKRKEDLDRIFQEVTGLLN
jgi:phosphomannomutase